MVKCNARFPTIVHMNHLMNTTHKQTTHKKFIDLCVLTQQTHVHTNCSFIGTLQMHLLALL